MFTFKKEAPISQQVQQRSWSLAPSRAKKIAFASYCLLAIMSVFVLALLEFDYKDKVCGSFQYWVCVLLEWLPSFWHGSDKARSGGCQKYEPQLVGIVLLWVSGGLSTACLLPSHYDTPVHLERTNIDVHFSLSLIWLYSYFILDWSRNGLQYRQNIKHHHDIPITIWNPLWDNGHICQWSLNLQWQWVSAPENQQQAATTTTEMLVKTDTTNNADAAQLTTKKWLGRRICAIHIVENMVIIKRLINQCCPILWNSRWIVVVFWTRANGQDKEMD